MGALSTRNKAGAEVRKALRGAIVDKTFNAAVAGDEDGVFAVATDRFAGVVAASIAETDFYAIVGPSKVDGIAKTVCPAVNQILALRLNEIITAHPYALLVEIHLGSVELPHRGEVIIGVVAPYTLSPHARCLVA